MWTVRSAAGTPLGYAWGLACLGAGFRWGTLTLADLDVATRLVGSTVVSGTVAVRVGMAAALLGAVLGEVHAGGFRARTWGERAAAAVAVATLAAVFVAGGSERLWPSALRWGLPAATATAAVLLLQPVLRLIPPALPIAITVVGVALALLGS